MAADGVGPYGRQVPSGVVEIACDESGFTGGNLTFRHTVFTHASLQVSVAAAEDEMQRLRAVVAGQRGELKSSWLLRWCRPRDLSRLLGPAGLLGGRAQVHLVDTRLFLLLRFTDVLLGPLPTSGLDLPGSATSDRAIALILHRHGEEVFGSRRWQDFLVAVGNVLRTNSRWVPATAVEDATDAVRELASRPAPAPVRGSLRRLESGVGRLSTIRRALEADSRRSPLLEPLLPALTRAVLTWGVDRPRLVVVHDEQSALTPWRLSDIGQLLAREHPGHTFALIRVDSRQDPRVQLADLLAGIARRAASGVLDERPDLRLVDLVRPFVDPTSIWPDDLWTAGHAAVGASAPEASAG